MTWSSSPVCARPVRTLDRSALKASRLLPILCSVLFLSSAMIIAHSRIRCGQSYVNQRALVLAEHYAAQGILLEDAEDIDRQLLVAAQGERGGVHHLEVLVDGLVEADARVALRARIVLGVGGVHPVDLGRLDHDLGAHLAAAQRGCRVGGEKGIAGAGGEND